ncbi:MAG: hypothetical protein IH810_05870 [Proteobacteria bacterium]|nr:hypothetical protein [Pseudomonadota bacterium]
MRRFEKKLYFNYRHESTCERGSLTRDRLAYLLRAARSRGEHIVKDGQFYLFGGMVIVRRTHPQFRTARKAQHNETHRHYMRSTRLDLGQRDFRTEFAQQFTAEVG